MVGTLIVVLLILALGTRAGDALEVRQQEIVLRKLPVAEAHAYYQQLRRRAWRTRALRAVAVLALITITYVARRMLVTRPVRRPGSEASQLEVGPARTTARASSPWRKSPVAETGGASPSAALLVG
jgi:hypothetical protein